MYGDLGTGGIHNMLCINYLLIVYYTRRHIWYFLEKRRYLRLGHTFCRKYGDTT